MADRSLKFPDPPICEAVRSVQKSIFNPLASKQQEIVKSSPWNWPLTTVSGGSTFHNTVQVSDLLMYSPPLSSYTLFHFNLITELSCYPPAEYWLQVEHSHHNRIGCPQNYGDLPRIWASIDWSLPISR